MARKEILQPNEVNSTLFVGVGGIGSRIIKRVADSCINDKVDNIRFVTLDTDVNELTQLENGSVITTVQTSSTRSIKDYLDFDTDAKENWFPENRILDSKTVSEGAGQVRAISRLALNATIRQGVIAKLYSAIDDLYLKDGADKSQAIKVVIASTVAGGTGSGIALAVAMIIRDYLNKNYPESAAIIRGFFIMPGVMDTVIKTESEKASQRRNGYATIKEINAFMMKGSGFFDSDPELMRYRDLSLTIPTVEGENYELDNLPFDFCFLLDRIDEKQHSMARLDQYEAFAAQSIYEQNIGPMRKSASSKEDNIVKEFIDPKKLGRCRFGGAGAAVLKYPYVDIRDYVALNWAEKSILGATAEKVSEEEKEALIKQSWLRYDISYKNELKKWESDNTASAQDEPILSEIYVNDLEKSDDDFSVMLREKYLNAKVRLLSDDEVSSDMAFEKKMEKVAESFINAMVSEAVHNHIERIVQTSDGNGNDASNSEVITNAKNPAEDEGLTIRYNAIRALSEINESDVNLEEIVKKFTKAAMKSENSIKRGSKANYTLEAYLSAIEKIMHPNAARYLLYKLEKALDDGFENSNYTREQYDKAINEITRGVDEDGKIDKKAFKVGFNLTKERSLEDMCDAVDSMNKVQEAADAITRKAKFEECDDKLSDYYSAVVRYYTTKAKRVICEESKPFVSALIKSFENFYNTFEGKVVSIEKEKENILDKISFTNGDCVMNLFADKEVLDMLVEDQGATAGNNADENELFGDIYDSAKKNATIAEREKNNPLLREVKKDIFDDIVLGYYKNLVEKTCDDRLDLDVLHGIKYEFEMECLVNMKKAQTEEQKQAQLKYSKDKKKVENYIKKKIERCRNLSSPGISKKDFEEARDVNAIAFGVGVKDGNGIYVNEYLQEKDRSATVSKYELHFFSSIYNVMPIQISKLSYGKPANDEERYSIHRKASGDYFKAYQQYMEMIGPDSRLNPVITPHIDKRWNAISVMPELDLEYQKDLMKYIHKAMLYGFVYGVISRYTPSAYAPDEVIYRYSDGANGQKPLIVSNHTACDELYEVLDALYFDRAAVNVIHGIAANYRKIDENATMRYEETAFAKKVNELSRMSIVDCSAEEEKKFASESKTSLFEIPILYLNSLPARKKDAAEIATMVGAIVDMIYQEVETFCDRKDVKPLVSLLIVKHFKLLVENYKKLPVLLGKGIDIMSNDAVIMIQKKLVETFNYLNIRVPEDIEKF